MIKAILFDNFGVITGDDYWHEVRNIEAANGNDANLTSLIENVNLGKIAWREFCASVAGDLKISEQEVEQRYRKYNLNRQVIALATRLKENYIVAMASNAHHEYLDPVLEETSLDKLFDPVFISSRMGAIKPSVDFYLKVVHGLNLSPVECLMIDDNQSNITGAESTGMNGILFNNADQLEQDLKHFL